jgi:hypothetical protein
MKNSSIIRTALAVVMASLLSACGFFIGPAKVLPLETVKPNETAFAIPLEGDTVGGQMKFESVSYLNSKKVQNKQIEIPVRDRSIGRWPGEFEWIATMRVIRVDRSLVTREWNTSGKDATQKNAAIAVESKESINFHVGINITALITEEDASTYLYWHNTKTLAEVIDTNIKGFVQGVLAREFGALTLEESKVQKNRVFAQADTETKEHFKKYGITVLNIGNAGGLEYDDQSIQASINRTQTAQMDVQVAEQQRLAQAKRNETNVAKAIADRQAAMEFAKAKDAQVARLELDIKMVEASAKKTQADASLVAAGRWTGSLPSQVLPASSGLLFGLDAPINTAKSK